MPAPFGCLAGRSALPLDPGDGGHRGMPPGRQGQAIEPTKSARSGSGCRVGSAQVPGWLVECLRLGVGHAGTVRPDPSTLGVAGERGSHHESCLQLVPGSAGQALDLFKVWCWDALGWSLEQRPRGIVRKDDGADVGEALLQVVVLEALVGRPHVHPQPVRAFISGPGTGPVQQLGAEASAAVGPVDRDLVGVQGRFGLLLLSPQLRLGEAVDGDRGRRGVVVVPDDEGLPASMLRSMPSTMRSSVGQGSCH
jgi:hypothetical protein